MISSKMSLHAFWSVPVKVWNSYENAMIQRLSEGSRTRGGKHEQICVTSFCMDCTGDTGEDPTGRHARRQDRDW